MAYLALRGSGEVNGVSRLHGEVSRRIFQPLFPRWPEMEVPIGHVTNGVHTPSWDSPAADALWAKASGRAPWQGNLDTIEQDLNSLGDEELWAMRRANRKCLVDYARERVVRQDAAGGVPGDASATRLDPEALTLGFARRFAIYKRPNLLLFNPQRLLALVTNADRPVQLIVAGKAHPADHDGQQMIQEWHRFIRTTAARDRVVFLADYDLELAEFLVCGVDVWLNTPRRPWEASGTSGMKVLVNGGLNLSELDGWWAEAYEPDVGWAIGDGQEHGDDPAVDATEANALYGLLEQEIVPSYYARDPQGIPTAWIAKMRASMGPLTPRFSANRAVREYTETYYLPAAERYHSRAARGGAAGADLLAWRDKAERGIANASFGAVRCDREGPSDRFSADVYLGDLDPGLVQVELYAVANGNCPPERHVMKAGPRIDGGECRYDVCVTTARPASDYTPRLIPHHPAASVPLESNAIRWQR
jgi:starch phosphorylase